MFPHTVLFVLSVQTWNYYNSMIQISWKDLFPQKLFFHWLGAFFTTAERLIWVSYFSIKIYFILFFQGWLINFNIILKTCFKIYLENLWKNGEFTLLNKPLETYKLPSNICQVNFFRKSERFTNVIQSAQFLVTECLVL